MGRMNERTARLVCLPRASPNPSGLPIDARLAHSALMSTKSRENIYGGAVRHSAERAAVARKEADQLACIAWNQRMLGFKGPAQPSPSLGDALNAGYLYLEVRCPRLRPNSLLIIVRRPKRRPSMRAVHAM